MFKPLCDWREIARDVHGRVLDYGRFLQERALVAGLCRFLARA